MYSLQWKVNTRLTICPRLSVYQWLGGQWSIGRVPKQFGKDRRSRSRRLIGRSREVSAMCGLSSAYFYSTRRTAVLNDWRNGWRVVGTVGGSPSAGWARLSTGFTSGLVKWVTVASASRPRRIKDANRDRLKRVPLMSSHDLRQPRNRFPSLRPSTSPATTVRNFLANFPRAICELAPGPRRYLREEPPRSFCQSLSVLLRFLWNQNADLASRRIFNGPVIGTIKVYKPWRKSRSGRGDNFTSEK